MSKIGRWSRRMSHSTKEILRDVANVMSGYREFKRNGSTSDEAYASMRRLYRKTNGRFNDAVGGLCRILHPKRSYDLSDSLLDIATEENVRQIASSLRRDGFYQFEQRLPAWVCKSLLEFSLSTPGEPVSLDGRQQASTLFNRANPQTVRHEISSRDLFANEIVQQLTTDPFLFGVAQEYLGFNPVLDVLAIWWSAPGDSAMQSRAAQLYHFDMDRFRFVKFFVYLTDVDTNNGPHCYVRGSHVRKPKSLLRDERILDEEIALHYKPEDRVELTGPTGTILAVDTRGFHKGKPLVERDRLILQIQFADSLFGQNYAAVPVPENVSDTTLNRIRQNKRCFSNLELPCV
jgi:hypothetical protein